MQTQASIYNVSSLKNKKDFLCIFNKISVHHDFNVIHTSIPDISINRRKRIRSRWEEEGSKEGQKVK